MPNWGQAFSNLGDGLGDISALMRRIELMKAQQEEETKRQLAVQAQAAAIERSKEIFQDPSKAAPPQSRLAGSALKDLSGADNLNKLPSEIEMLARARASGMDTSAQPGVGLRTDFNAMRPEINDLMASRNARQKALTDEASVPDRQIETTNPDGSQSTQMVSTRAGGSYNTGLSTEQTELNKANANKAALPTNIANANATEAGTRGEKAKTAGATAFSQAQGQGAGHAPFEKPDLVNTPDGGSTGLKWDAKTQSYKEVKPPVEVTKGPGASKLTQGQVETIATANTAEVEGVKILAELKKAGLDKSNNPADPRWQRFLAGTLKMSGDDVTKSDIQQRTAYVQAAVLRSLMAGRPSKWIAEIYMQHIPQGDMTGSKLTQVLTNVLQQTGEKRSEIGSLTGHDKIGPTSGMTFQQWLDSQKGAVDPAQTGAAKLNNR